MERAPATTLPAGTAGNARGRYLQVALAAVFINTSYGTMSYAFSVLVTKSAAGGAFGGAVVSAGFGLALLVSGVAAIGAGTVADLFGSRRLMAGGTLMGAAGLALFAAAREPWQVLVLMPLILGPAMAATFYEPVYVLMNRWFGAADRPRAYGLLTMLSGVSITIFTPLTQALVDGLGWREGVLVLAGILLAVGLLVPLALDEARTTDARAPSQGPRAFLREAAAGARQATASFWAFGAASFVAAAAFSGFSFHMVAQLETRGFEAGWVAAVIGLTGVISLPGRFLIPSLTARASASAMLAVVLALLAAAAWIASAADDWWLVWVYLALFGAIFGAVYPLRALVVSERFSGPYFGRLIGIQALMLALGRAAGPIAVGAIGTDRTGYELGFRIAAGVLVASAVAGWLAMRGSPEPMARARLMRDRG